MGATMLRRASSNFSFLPATTCASVCGGAAGVSRRSPWLRGLGPARRLRRRGAVTSIVGKRGGAGSGGRGSATAPGRRDRQQQRAAPEAAKWVLTNTDMVPIPMKPPPIRRGRRIRRLAVDMRRTDFDLSGGSAAHDAAIPRGSSSNRCQEMGGARGWKATRAEFRWTNSASVIRYRNSTACGSSNSGGVANNTVLATPSRRRSRRRRGAGRNRDWTALLLADATASARDGRGKIRMRRPD